LSLVRALVEPQCSPKKKKGDSSAVGESGEEQKGSWQVYYSVYWLYWLYWCKKKRYTKFTCFAGCSVYRLYWLYWYKSTITDAAGCAHAVEAAIAKKKKKCSY
jgi:hypothetical protein